MTQTSQLCPLDCPDACSLSVTVEDGRVVKVDGDHRNPVTAGYICGKVRRFPKYMYSADRVVRPYIRRADVPKTDRSGDPTHAFREASWDEALDAVAKNLARVRGQFGGEAILPACYGGSNGYLSHGLMDQRLFRRLGASKLLHTICAAPSGAAQALLYGRMPGVAFQDFAHCRLIVVWGMNPSSSGIHAVPFIRQAQKNGAKLVVVDPRRIQLAKDADLHLPLRPGTDLPVALALAHWLFEAGRVDEAFLASSATGVSQFRRRAAAWTLTRAAETAGVREQDLETLAHWYADASPALIRCGWGVERNRNGASAVGAVLALPALAGKFGVRGGGYTMSNSAAWSLAPETAVGEPEPAVRQVNMNQLGRALTELTDPPVKALYVYNGNPASTFPDQERVRRGLERPDLFTVVHEQVWTDSCVYADVVLPAPTFLEQDELARGYGNYVLQKATPAVQPVGEARSNFEVFMALCDRLGLGRPDDLRDPEQCAVAIVAADPDGERIWRELNEKGLATPTIGNAPVQFGDIFPGTPDGKVHLWDDAADAEAPAGLFGFQADPGSPTFPLALISPSSADRITGTFGNLRAKVAVLSMHPEDAAARSVASGDGLRVFNELGEMWCVAKVTDEVRPGVVEMPKGIWDRETGSGNSANALCPDTLSDLGGGACFNDARVQVERRSQEA
jgi:anaerobic selenocysteine-containing dehydrogenase